jgi:hypothetical protein
VRSLDIEREVSMTADDIFASLFGTSKANKKQKKVFDEEINEWICMSLHSQAVVRSLPELFFS